jgi:hypothetical protein
MTTATAYPLTGTDEAFIELNAAREQALQEAR